VSRLRGWTTSSTPGYGSSWARAICSWCAVTTTEIRSSVVSGEARSIVVCISERSPASTANCLGRSVP